MESGLLGERANSRAGAANIKGKLGTSCCQKVRKYSKNDGDVSQGPRN